MGVTEGREQEEEEGERRTVKIGDIKDKCNVKHRDTNNGLWWFKTVAGVTQTNISGVMQFSNM